MLVRGNLSQLREKMKRSKRVDVVVHLVFFKVDRVCGAHSKKGGNVNVTTRVTGTGCGSRSLEGKSCGKRCDLFPWGCWS